MVPVFLSWEVDYFKTFLTLIALEWGGRKNNIPSLPIVIGPLKYFFAFPMNKIFKMGERNGGMM
jgi:hypothetical protein